MVSDGCACCCVIAARGHNRREPQMHVKTLARNAMVRQDFIVRPDTKFVRPIFPQECAVLRVSRASKMATAEIAEPRNPQRGSFSQGFPFRVGQWAFSHQRNDHLIQHTACEDVKFYGVLCSFYE